MKKICLLFLIAISFCSWGATYNMSTGTKTVTCGTTDNFYDSGGSASGYSNSESYTLTVTVGTLASCSITVSFSSFATESFWDVLTIYDGTGAQLGSFSGNTSPGTITTATGSFTFVFSSDFFNNAAGWAATISCTSSCSGTPTAGAASASPSALSCGTATTALSLSGATSGCGISYQWQSSPNNSTWSNISGATGATYTPTVSSNTYYQCIVSCGAANATSSPVLISVTTGGPSNDLCANATAITINTTNSNATNSTIFTGSVVGTNYCAGADQGNTSCFSNTGNLWYKFVPSSSGSYYVGVQAGTMLYPEVAVLSGSCGSFSTLGCSGVVGSTSQPNGYSNSTYAYAGGCDLTAGTTYYVMVDSWSTQGTFTLTIQSLSNDLIAGAAMLSNCGTSFTSSTIGATNCNNGLGDGYHNNIDNNLSTTYPGSSGGSDVPSGMSVDNDSYYQFCVTSAASFSVTVTPTNSTCIGPYAGTSTELQYILYTGSSTSLTPVCSYTALGSAATCTISMSANQCAYILVDGAAGTNCDYSIVLNANPGCPLPIQLVEFKGENIDEGKIKLTWELAKENEISYYNIERSPDGNDYSSIGKVLSTSNTSHTETYYTIDEKPLIGNNYYRLIPVNTNGNASVAATILVTNKASLSRFVVYPNPSEGILNISLFNFFSPTVQVEILDARGKIIWDSDIEIKDGNSVQQLDLTSFSSGLYIVKANDGFTMLKQTVLINKGRD